ncbi:hypothetical protein chiPu_0023860, partial [Chiloscyllium punctatum]|nr:hypothetical protein [Chiloscyllium punctatum]
YELVCDDAWKVDMSQACIEIGFFLGALIAGYAADSLIPESPRWLLTRMRIKEALKIAQNIAEQNGKSLPSTYKEVIDCVLCLDVG